LIAVKYVSRNDTTVACCGLLAAAALTATVSLASACVGEGDGAGVVDAGVGDWPLPLAWPAVERAAVPRD